MSNGINVINNSDSNIWVSISMRAQDANCGGSEAFFTVPPTQPQTWGFRTVNQIAHIVRSRRPSGDHLELITSVLQIITMSNTITVVNNSEYTIWVDINARAEDLGGGGSEGFSPIAPNGASAVWGFRTVNQVAYIARSSKPGARLEVRLAVPGGTMYVD
ncbi:hypothetical protein D9757_003332 [Collybiopsis confluens]|uniref:Uncharacterized protein n=1 Tax=Collybiopsis confluens TaxID=2823264 RepID=A0A8H5HZ61_9AGAR|nr:hypothetical protein D9757_003332 [Collybiopsis confluens]